MKNGSRILSLKVWVVARAGNHVASWRALSLRQLASPHPAPPLAPPTRGQLRAAPGKWETRRQWGRRRFWPAVVGLERLGRGCTTNCNESARSESIMPGVHCFGSRKILCYSLLVQRNSCLSFECWLTLINYGRKATDKNNIRTKLITTLLYF